MDSKTTRRFAVIGKPVGHSLSPAIHQAFFRQHGLDAQYDRREVEPGTAGTALEHLATEGLEGLNVTFPLKKEVLPHLASLDETAAELGAVNTLTRIARSSPGRVFRGSNTDGAGFCEYVERDMRVPLAGRRILFLGAGSTVRSILLELGRRGAGSVHLINRSLERLEDPALRRLAARFPEFRATALGEIAGPSWDEVFRVDLVVHATSLGLSGSKGDFPWPLERLPSDRPVIDLNYLPDRPTPFLERLGHVREKRDGKGMLLYQAAKAFELWWGFFPRVEGLLDELFPAG